MLQIIGVGVFVGVDEAVGSGEGVGFGVDVGVGVGVGVLVGVGELVGVAVGQITVEACIALCTPVEVFTRQYKVLPQLYLSHLVGFDRTMGLFVPWANERYTSNDISGSVDTSMVN